MLGLVEGFFDRQLAFLWEQTVPHYDMFLYSYENAFLDELIKEGKGSLLESSISHIVILMTLSLSIRKGLKNSFLIFTIKNLPFLRLQNLDLLFTRDENNNITTKLYEKRDELGFHIVNFPFISSNIPSAPGYDVYVSQLILYALCCSNYSDF